VRFSFDQRTPYRELREPPLPDALRALALDCFAAQRRALATSPEPTAAATPDSDAVSGAALGRLLASGETAGGIVTRRELATAIPFNARHTRDAVRSSEVAARRRRLDDALGRWLTSLFDAGRPPILSAAGQWWYPPGTYFGWHTNQGYPGWRLYLSYAEEPGRSFFRYRDPVGGEIVTSADGRWDLRFFEVSAERLFWHAIASDTHRFSVGWMVRPWSLRNAARAGVARLRARWPGAQT
jgi:hypothetical protein